jgi:serine protease Do
MALLSLLALGGGLMADPVLAQTTRPSTQPADKADVTATPLPLAGPATRPGSPILNSARTPRSVDELLEIQTAVERVVDEAMPATVGLTIDNSQGSGVIVNSTGLILTAAHVSGEAGQPVLVHLSTGKTVNGRTLGLNKNTDAGLIQITDPGPYPFVLLGSSAKLKNGQWVVALGHPGGYRKDRPAVVRVGRLLSVTNAMLRSDTTLVGGDSGGPLFDLEGHVIGIHSRIGESVETNLHVAVDRFAADWKRMLAGDSWGGRELFRVSRGPVIGVQCSNTPGRAGVSVDALVDGQPAAVAGVKVGDVIVAIDGDKVATFDDLLAQMERRKVGQEIVVHVLRNGQPLTFTMRTVPRKLTQ